MRPLEEIKRDADAATPGPWATVRIETPCAAMAEPHHDLYAGLPGETGDNIACHNASADDAAFIANARTDVPDLVALVERLRDALSAIVSVAEAAERNGCDINIETFTNEITKARAALAAADGTGTQTARDDGQGGM